MLKQLAQTAKPVLDLPVVRRTRRNHGLEHATIHLLSQRIKGLQMAGRSTESGFVLIGEAPTEAVEAAVYEALRRMRNGEHNLAIHPNCGTNLVTTGFLTSLVGFLGISGASRRDSLNRLPAVMVLMMLTVLFSQPLGTAMQKYFTTDGDPADLEIVSITRSQMRMPFASGPVTIHRVVTRSN
ncbi:MAG: DUF6391 domain-containing protein [Chloroflexota bacterium]|nr:MAG: hypothetical protein DIU68_03945 [Chloroflexota bacterium]